MDETISRTDLVRIVDEAARSITESTRAKLLAVAESTDAVAVGWFHCDGVGCPARQARRRNQRFQQAFDTIMARRFEVDADDNGTIAPFVLRVER